MIQFLHSSPLRLVISCYCYIYIYVFLNENNGDGMRYYGLQCRSTSGCRKLVLKKLRRMHHHPPKHQKMCCLRTLKKSPTVQRSSSRMKTTSTCVRRAISRPPPVVRYRAWRSEDPKQFAAFFWKRPSFLQICKWYRNHLMIYLTIIQLNDGFLGVKMKLGVSIIIYLYDLEWWWICLLFNPYWTDMESNKKKWGNVKLV